MVLYHPAGEDKGRIRGGGGGILIQATLSKLPFYTFRRVAAFVLPIADACEDWGRDKLVGVGHWK